MENYTRELIIKLGVTDTKTKLERLRKKMRDLGGVHSKGGAGVVTQTFEFKEPLSRHSRELIAETVFDTVTCTTCTWQEPKKQEENK